MPPNAMACVRLAKTAQLVDAARQSHASTKKKSTQKGNQQQLIYPDANADWVRTHRPELVSFGICSRFLKNGDCSADGCPFEHGIPASIDLNSTAWKDAVQKAAAYRARMAERNEQNDTANNSGAGGMRSAGVRMPTVSQMRMPNTSNNSQVAAPATVGAPAESLPVSPREAPPPDAIVAYHALVGSEDFAAEEAGELPPLPEKPLINSAVLDTDDPWDVSNMKPLTVMQRP